MKKIVIPVLLVIWSLLATGQDIHFSQFSEASMLLNPALTGCFNGEHRLTTNAKSQWQTIGGQFRTYAFAYENRRNTSRWLYGNDYLAIGTLVYADKAGDLDLSTINASINVAYNVSIAYNQTLGAALSGGMGQKSINMTQAQWDEQYDVNIGGYNPAFSSNEPNIIDNFFYPDFGFGMLWTQKRRSTGRTSNDGIFSTMGLGIHHINSPLIKFYTGKASRISPRATFHARSEIGISYTTLSIAPAMYYSAQNKMKELVFGSSFKYQLVERSIYTSFMNSSYLTLGAYYRYGDALIAVMQIEMSGIVLGISYDATISKLKVPTHAMNGIEISLRYMYSSDNKRFYY